MQAGYLLDNRYQIKRPLAAGGFGQTYLAIDTKLPSKPQVVVKLLKPMSNDSAILQIARRLFETEAETLEKLGKGNDRIPSLYAHFELGGEFYLVQEFIDGMTLTEELNGQQISESDTLDILKEILIGLETVHDRDIVHRDLKPDNIIRRASDGKLVLIDFGAVKQIRVITGPKNNRTVCIGTPGYMPDEQTDGWPQLASDIYAVGAIGIQCLTGIAPNLLFNKNGEIEWEHLRKIDPDFAKVLNKMIAPDHRQRYANAAEALQAIESLNISSVPKVKLPSPTIQPPVPPVVTGGFTLPPTVPVPVTPTKIDRHKKIHRRSFIKWWLYGGTGIVLCWLIDEWRKPPYLPIADILSQSGTPLKLTKIRFYSFNLNRRYLAKADIFTEDLGDGVKLTMVKIPTGKFLMGSPKSEVQRSEGESPQHEVTVAGFYLAQTLVTEAQWRIITNFPINIDKSSRFVQPLNWIDSMDFCEKLSEKTGRTYRLPSEAEWEYACRAGTTTPFAFGDTITPEMVDFRGNFVQRIFHPELIVGKLSPNLFGLYDMHGQWQWCLDEWFDNYDGAPTDGSARGDIKSRDKNKLRLLRGGSWNEDSSGCRSAIRGTIAAENRAWFRVLLAQN